jgi:hypothetical protein
MSKFYHSHICNYYKRLPWYITISPRKKRKPMENITRKNRNRKSTQVELVPSISQPMFTTPSSPLPYVASTERPKQWEDQLQHNHGGNRGQLENLDINNNIAQVTPKHQIKLSRDIAKSTGELTRTPIVSLMQYLEEHVFLHVYTWWLGTSVCSFAFFLVLTWR